MNTNTTFDEIVAGLDADDLWPQDRLPNPGPLFIAGAFLWGALWGVVFYAALKLRRAHR